MKREYKTNQVHFVVQENTLDNGGVTYEIYENRDAYNAPATTVEQSESVYTSTNEYDLAEWLERYIKNKKFTHVSIQNYLDEDADVILYAYEEIINEMVDDLSAGVPVCAMGYEETNDEEFTMLCKFVGVNPEVAKEEEMWLQDAYEEKVRELLSKGDTFKDYDDVEVNFAFSPKIYWAGDETCYFETLKKQKYENRKSKI